MRTFREGGVMIGWLGPLGRLWMPMYHAILGGVGVVAFRVQFSEECCCGMYNTVFVMNLTVYFYCGNEKAHALLYNVIVTFFVILFFVLPCVLSCPALRAEERRSSRVAESPATPCQRDTM